jgi:hypothetical protein
MEESDEKTNQFIFSSVLSIFHLSDHYRRNLSVCIWFLPFPSLRSPTGLEALWAGGCVSSERSEAGERYAPGLWFSFFFNFELFSCCNGYSSAFWITGGYRLFVKR